MRDFVPTSHVNLTNNQAIRFSRYMMKRGFLNLLSYLNLSILICILMLPNQMHAQSTIEKLDYVESAKDLKSDPFVAMAGDVQHPGLPFVVSIEDATDGVADLQGNHRVRITSIDGGFVGEGELFDDNAFFIDGNANITVTLTQVDEHRLFVELVDQSESVTISPDITVIDFSGFDIDLATSGYAKIPYTLEITNAFNVAGAFLTGPRRVTVTSNQEGVELFFDEIVTFGTTGTAEIEIILENSSATGLLHTLAIDIDGVFQTKVHEITIQDNKADFSIRFVDGAVLEEELAITAGVEFKIRVIGVVDPSDGTTFVTGLTTIIVRSKNPEQQPFERSFEVTLDSSGDSPDLILNPNDSNDETNTFTLAGATTVEAIIPSLGKSVEQSGLTITPDLLTHVIIDQQPVNGTGNYDSQPVLLSPIIVTTGDRWGNQVVVDYTEIGVELVNEDTDATLAGEGVIDEENFLYGLEIGSDIQIDQLEFNQLNLDRNGTFRLRFVESSYGYISAETVEFTMTNMESLASFVIEDPGPQVRNAEFDWPITSAQNFQEDILDGPYVANVFALSGINETIENNIPFDIVEGNGLIPVTIPNSISTTPLDVRITIQSIGPSGGDHFEDYVGLITVAEGNDQSTFSIAEPPTQYAARPFSLSISNARAKNNDLLNSTRQVTITTPESTFQRSILFDDGNATIDNVVLNQTGINQEITVSIDWITLPQTAEVDVEDGIEIRDSDNNIVGLEDLKFVFPALVSGYTLTEAEFIAETFTISRVGSGTVTNLEVSASANFNVTGPSITQLDNTNPTAEFTLTPVIDKLPPGVEEQVSVSYATGDPKPSIAFAVDFPVNDSYQVSITKLPSDLVNDNQELTIAAGTDFRLANTGTGVITNLDIFLGGQNPGAFTISFSDPSFDGTLNPVAPGNTTDFLVEPATGLSSGIYNATVNIIADNGLSRQFRIRHEVFGTELEVSISPASPVFYGVYSAGYTSAEATRTFTISNIGEAISDFDIATASGSGFTVDYTPGTISQGGTATFTISATEGVGNGQFRSETFTLTIYDAGDPVSSETASIEVSILIDELTWAGPVNSSYPLGNNWLPVNYESGTWGTLTPIAPTRFTNVVIPEISVSPRYPVISNTSERIRNLTIQDGASLTMTGGASSPFPSLTIDATRTLDIKHNAFMSVGNNAILTNNGTIEVRATGTTNRGHLSVANSLVNTGTLRLFRDGDTEGGRLTVTPTGQITSTPTVDGIVNPTGNDDNFVIESDATGSGSVILNNPDVFATVQRWMKADMHIHLLTSPVKEQPILDILNQDVDIRAFNEDTHDWTPWGTPPTGNFDRGRGYIMSPDLNDELTVNFQGELDHGDFTYVARRDKFGWNAIGNPYPSGFNAHAFLNDNMEHMQSGFKALYVYDYERERGDRYRVFNLIDGPSVFSNMQGFFVRVGETNGEALPYNLDFTNAQRIHQPGASYFKDGQYLPDWYKVRLIMKAPDQQSSTLVAFNEYMTEGIDEGYDAASMGFTSGFNIYSNATGFASNLSVRALPDDFENILVPLGIDYSGSDEVLLTAEADDLPYFLTPLLYDSQNGTYTELTAAGFSILPGPGAEQGRYFLKMQDSRNIHSLTYQPANIGGEVVALLNDEMVDSETELAEGVSVFLNALPSAGYETNHWTINGQLIEGTGNELTVDRVLTDTHIEAFFAEIGKSGDQALDAGNVTDTEIYIYVSEGQIVINGLLEEGTTARLFDLSGRKILERNLHEGPVQTIHPKELKEGVYMLHIGNEQNQQTKRLFIR